MQASYDVADRMTRLAIDSALFHMGYNNTFDEDGRITSQIAEHAPNSGFFAHYDSLGRLTQYLEGNVDERLTASTAATLGPQKWNWQLDGVNNWVNVTKDSVTTPATFNGENQAIGTTYDLNGNTGGSFDALNRLRKTGDTSYTYDALNRRTASMTNTTTGLKTTQFVYDGVNLIESLNGTTLRFVNGLAADEHILMDQPGGSVHYYVQDRLASVIALTDSTGALSEAYLYDAYGTPTVVHGSWSNPILDHTPGYGNPFLYTGQQYDAATGLMYYKARYYDPQAGRFLSRDPIGVWGDQSNLGNGYGYAASSPLGIRDPTGTCGAWWNAWAGGCLWSAGIAAGNMLWNLGDDAGNQMLDWGGYYEHPKQSGVRFPGTTGRSSMAGTFGVPFISNERKITVEFFIMSSSVIAGFGPVIAGFGPLRIYASGDGRFFDGSPNLAEWGRTARAFFELDWSAGSGYVQLNPTCGPSGCKDARSFGSGWGYNQFEVHSSGNSIEVRGALTNSLHPWMSASIDFDLTFTIEANDVLHISGNRDPFPSMQIFRGDVSVYQSPETTINTLTGYAGKETIEGSSL